MSRVEIRWGDLRAIEPTREELMQYSAALAEGYNHPANAALMGHTSIISPREVVESYEHAMAEGMRAFLFFAGDAFAGDGDLRNLRRGAAGTTAEFAFMVAMPAAQGKGLGTRYATMVHAFGFTRLSLERIYASVVPENTASKRVFEKLGYLVDDSPQARDYAEEPGDLTLSLTHEVFVERHRPLLDEIRIGVR